MSALRTLFVAGMHENSEDADECILPLGKTLIGKGSNCDICLGHPTVSRRHAEIVNDGTALTITDTYSLNGVIVNGDLIPPGAPCKVNEGDTIQIGKLKMKIQYTNDTISV